MKINEINLLQSTGFLQKKFDFYKILHLVDYPSLFYNFTTILCREFYFTKNQ